MFNNLNLARKTHMIDTLALTLRRDMFQITDPDKFTPSTRWIEDYGKSMHSLRSKQNPAKKELLRGIYKPCLTLSYCFTSTRTRELMLRIELSLPKLLYGNNFQELQYKDFKPLVQKLAATLETMGVIVVTYIRFGKQQLYTITCGIIFS